ncbi:MAG: thymidylate kinase [Oscillospiraceae bacterium]|nr:thymidylate kinase [Oscillospiraceae bacterium]
MGKLIVIDGVDASGKETQTKLLKERLEAMGERVRMISFPAYDNPSSTLVRMYLNGDFGKNPDDVNAYAASSFFAADRYATYKSDWGADYADSGTIILADRYVSSNMIHQASKLKSSGERSEFMAWLDDFEHNRYGLPRPDVTLFLDMPVECGQRLMSERANKIDGSKSRDIHESNTEYLYESYNTAVFAAEKYGWKRIFCVEDNELRSVGDINDEIFEIVKGVIK